MPLISRERLLSEAVDLQRVPEAVVLGDDDGGEPRRRAARASSIGRRLLSLAPRVVWMCMSMMLPVMRSRLSRSLP